MRTKSAESTKAMEQEAAKKAPKVMKAIEKAEKDLDTVFKQASRLDGRKWTKQGWDEEDIKCFEDALHLMIECSKVFSHCANYLIKYSDFAPKEIDDKYEKNVDLLGRTFVMLRTLEEYYRKGGHVQTLSEEDRKDPFEATMCTCRNGHTEDEPCTCRETHKEGSGCICDKEPQKEDRKPNQHMHIPVDTEQRYRSARDAWFGKGRYR